MDDIDEGTRVALYSWIDEIPLSKPKKNFSRDFSDGRLVAEIIKHFLPKYVELHNYESATNGTERKEKNWRTLNKKVFKKMGFETNDAVINKLAKADDTTIEYFLLMLKDRINVELMTKSPRNKRRTDRKDNSKPEAYQLLGSTKGKSTRQAADINNHDRYHYLRPDPAIERISMLELDRRDYPTIVKQKVVRTIAESDNVPRILYEEKEKESKELDGKIEEVEYKLQALEELIRLKDIRIQYTEQRIDELKPFEFGQGGFVPQQIHEHGGSTFRKGNYMTQQK